MPLSATSKRLVERGDLDELTMRVNGLVADGDWEELAELREGCRRAVERGKQLWPVASHIEYRLCLEGPPVWAATMVEQAGGRFALGPLTEVAASAHTWEELAPHLNATPQAAMVAHERVVRGEDLGADARAAALPEVLDLPLHLMPWEPEYAVALYHPDKLEAPTPRLPQPATAYSDAPGAPPPENPAPSHPAPSHPAPSYPAPSHRHDFACTAMEELVSAWTEESNGRAEAVCVDGPARLAITALGARHARTAELRLDEAMALMAWAAASGGAHGRRRGAAAGRFGAWWAVAALCGCDDGPLAVARLGEAASGFAWYLWDAGEPGTGWACRLAVAEAPAPGGGHLPRSWALAATDAA
ncbi:MAG TPA: DUF6183 family protein [Acidimicrobiales bacterium]|nr:DUF6183 family protein [Acidimicrobiales bacterium]